MFGKDELYNGVWTKRSNLYFVALGKHDAALTRHAMYVFHWYGLLNRAPGQTTTRGPSVVLPEGFVEGLPGVRWVSGLSKHEIGVYLDLTDTSWDFVAPDLITIPLERLQSWSDRLAKLGLRGG